MVFCPCCLMESFPEVIPVTVVTSFPGRLEINSGNAGTESPEGTVALQPVGSRSDHQHRAPADETPGIFPSTESWERCAPLWLLHMHLKVPQ